MPCYHPISIHDKKGVPGSTGTSLIKVPCGQCIGCRLEKSRQWAIRCVHEAKMNVNNCFITLTYDNDHLPENKSVSKYECQTFFKRLRRLTNAKITYYVCGEYGESCRVCGKSQRLCSCGRGKFQKGYGRPHYHACIFGYDFQDKIPAPWGGQKGGNKLYVSPTLEALWKKGIHSIGEVNFETAAYIARYCTKKLNGQRAIEYEGREPEFALMSRRPAIGKTFLDKYQNDIYPSDMVVIRNNLKCRPPRYYDQKYDLIDNASMESIKQKRKENFNKLDNTFERLKSKEICKQAKSMLLSRSYESEAV